LSGPDLPNADSSLHKRIRRHIIGPEGEFFAVVTPGFEGTARRELSSLLPEREIVTGPGGCSWKGSQEDLYLASLAGRTVTRFLMRLRSFRADSPAILEKKGRAVPWELFFSPGSPLEFSVTCHKSKLMHTGLIEEVLRRAMEPSGAGKGTDESNKQTLFVRFERDTCSLSLDASGDPLYRRGYRSLVHRATLRETLSAAILLEAGVENYSLVLDPMCGSGAFPLEAAGILSGDLPGAGRKHALEGWPSFRPAAFNHIRKKHCRHKDIRTRILARDTDPAALELLETNRQALGPAPHIEAKQGDFFQAPPPSGEGKKLLVANPPYGKRLAADSLKLYEDIGKRLREAYREWDVALIVPDEKHLQAAGLTGGRTIRFFHGGLHPLAVFL
jgi:putative N6-adenine-specific DNA methylase